MNPHLYNLNKAAYSVTETMAQLSVGRTKLYSLIKKGDLRPVKLGKKTIFHAGDLADFLSKLRAAA